MARLRFWISSFIPAHVPGYTVTVGVGRHSGKTAVPLPAIARAWPGNWLKSWNAGYLTDQRTFSTSPAASSRMNSLIDIEIDATSGACTEISQAHTSSGTTEVDLHTGVQTGFAVANMSRCRYSADPSMTSFHFFRRLEAAAGDPLVGMAADIDYRGTLILTIHRAGLVRPTVVVDFEGLVDNFPAYECCAMLDGMPLRLFSRPPPSGNTVADLLGAANNPVSGRATF